MVVGSRAVSWLAANGARSGFAFMGAGLAGDAAYQAADNIDYVATEGKRGTLGYNPVQAALAGGLGAAAPALGKYVVQPLAARSYDYLSKVMPQARYEGAQVGGMNSALDGVRGVGSPLRASRLNVLNEEEIALVTKEWKALGGDPNALRFNRSGANTGYGPSGKVYINGDVFPAPAGSSTHPTANLSVRETLAHEMGHMAHPETKLAIQAWNDEFRASYWASKNVPNLTFDEQRNLAIDAWQKAMDAGQKVKLNNYLREMIYGY